MYKVIKSTDLDNLVEQVNNEVAAGGKTLGGVAIGLSDYRGNGFEVYANHGVGRACPLYIQAMEVQVELKNTTAQTSDTIIVVFTISRNKHRNSPDIYGDIKLAAKGSVFVEQTANNNIITIKASMSNYNASNISRKFSILYGVI